MKNLTYIIGVFITCAVFYSCKTKSRVMNIADGELKYSLVRGACFGKCPVYQLKIYEGGLAEYHGDMFVEREGKYKKQLSNSEYQALENTLAKANITSLKESYEEAITDLPITIIGYNTGNGYKKSKANNSRPDNFRTIEKALDEIVHSDGWESLNPRNEMSEDGGIKKIENNISNEVIIKPKKSLFLPAWIKDRSNYGVKLIKEIGAGLEMYLIRFDESKISQKDFMFMLKMDKEIETAEINKKVDMR